MPASTLGQNFGSKLNEPSGEHYGKEGFGRSPILKSNKIKVAGTLGAKEARETHATILGRRSKLEGRQRRLSDKFQANFPRNCCAKLLEPSPWRSNSDSLWVSLQPRTDHFLSSTSTTRMGFLPALKTSCVTLASRQPASPDLKFTVSSFFPFSAKPSEPSSRITPTWA